MRFAIDKILIGSSMLASQFDSIGKIDFSPGPEFGACQLNQNTTEWMSTMFLLFSVDSGEVGWSWKKTRMNLKEKWTKKV